MSQKFQGVFVPKHKTEEEWAKSNYIPSLGEIVIYDPTEITPFYRFKRGNGVLQVPQIANFMTMKEYSLEKRGNNIILRDSEGKESSIPDTDLSNYATLKYVDDEINDKTLGFFSNKSSDDQERPDSIEIANSSGRIVKLMEAGVIFGTPTTTLIIDDNGVAIQTDKTRPIATEEYVDTAIANIQIPDVDLTGYATEEYVDTAIENIPEQVQADWKQTDETAPDYIKNKFGLERGEAEKTTQQPGSRTISEGATAFGVNNFAGLKSFKIDKWSAPVKHNPVLADGLEYELSSDGNSYYVTGIGTVTATDIIIPDSHNGLPVTMIQMYAFHRCENLTSVEIPDTVIHISDYAFSATTYPNNTLKYVILPDGVYLGETCFGNRSIEAFICKGAISGQIEDDSMACLSSTHIKNMYLKLSYLDTELWGGTIDNKHYNLSDEEMEAIIVNLKTKGSNGSYTLSSPLPEEIPVGAEFGIQAKLIYYRHGTITAISEERDIVTVDNYVDIQAQIDKEINKGNDPNIVKRLWFTDYPTVGDTDEGAYAFTVGSGNFATHYAATALGIDNKTIGKYGTTFGKQNEAHYAAIAGGYNSKAIAEEAIALGYNAEASGKISTAIGQGVKATQKNQIVLGRYNAPADDAIFVVGNGSGTNRSNAFTVSEKGVLNADFEPKDATNLTNKRYVDNIINPVFKEVRETSENLNVLSDRLSNFEAGYVTIEGSTKTVTLPEMLENDIIISKIGGKTVVGINKANLNKLVSDTNKATCMKDPDDENKININYTKLTGGVFGFGIEIDVTPNTNYRIQLDKSASSISSVHFYTTELWGSTKATVLNKRGVEIQNSVFTEDYVLFNSANNSKLVIGFYSNYKDRKETEYVSNLIITQGWDEVEYVPYEVFPCKTTSVISSSGNSYDIPPEIQNLDGYGHKDSVVDFMNLTYSYKTIDGKKFSSIPTVESIAHIVSEAPHLEVESEGTITFVNDQTQDVETSILYKKDVKPVEVIDNLTSTDSTAALSANMGRELNEKISNPLSTKYVTISDDFSINDEQVLVFAGNKTTAIEKKFSPINIEGNEILIKSDKKIVKDSINATIFNCQPDWFYTEAVLDADSIYSGLTVEEASNTGIQSFPEQLIPEESLGLETGAQCTLNVNLSHTFKHLDCTVTSENTSYGWCFYLDVQNNTFGPGSEYAGIWELRVYDDKTLGLYMPKGMSYDYTIPFDTFTIQVPWSGWSEDGEGEVVDSLNVDYNKNIISIPLSNSKVIVYIAYQVYEKGAVIYGDGRLYVPEVISPTITTQKFTTNKLDVTRLSATNLDANSATINSLLVNDDINLVGDIILGDASNLGSFKKPLQSIYTKQPVITRPQNDLVYDNTEISKYVAILDKITPAIYTLNNKNHIGLDPEQVYNVIINQGIELGSFGKFTEIGSEANHSLSYEELIPLIIERLKDITQITLKLDDETSKQKKMDFIDDIFSVLSVFNIVNANVGLVLNGLAVIIKILGTAFLGQDKMGDIQKDIDDALNGGIIFKAITNGTIGEEVAEFFADMFSTIIQNIQDKHITPFIDGFNSIVNRIVEDWTAAKNFVGSVVDSISLFFMNVYNAISSYIQKTKENWGNLTEELKNQAREDLKKAEEDYATFGQTVVDGFNSLFGFVKIVDGDYYYVPNQDKKNSIQNTLNSFFQNMKDWFSESPDNADIFADWFVQAFDKMSDAKKAEITNRITSR